MVSKGGRWQGGWQGGPGVLGRPGVVGGTGMVGKGGADVMGMGHQLRLDFGGRHGRG